MASQVKGARVRASNLDLLKKHNLSFTELVRLAFANIENLVELRCEKNQ